jgi:hypothetical protein
MSVGRQERSDDHREMGAVASRNRLLEGPCLRDADRTPVQLGTMKELDRITRAFLVLVLQVGDSLRNARPKIHRQLARHSTPVCFE